MDIARDAATGLVLAAAALAGLGVLVKWLRGGFRAVEDGADLLNSAEDIKALLALQGDIKRLLERELQHNHGSSLKDDVHGIAVSLHRAHNRIDGVEDALLNFAEANRMVLPIIHDAINAQPPEEPL